MAATPGTNHSGENMAAVETMPGLKQETVLANQEDTTLMNAETSNQEELSTVEKINSRKSDEKASLNNLTDNENTNDTMEITLGEAQDQTADLNPNKQTGEVTQVQISQAEVVTGSETAVSSQRMYSADPALEIRGLFSSKRKRETTTAKSTKSCPGRNSDG